MKADRITLKKRANAAPKKPKLPQPPPRSSQGYQSSQSNTQADEFDTELTLQDFVMSSERFNPRDVQELAEGKRVILL